MGSLLKRCRRSRILRKGMAAFTLFEICVVIALAGTVIYAAWPAMAHARRDSLETKAKATAQALNQARDRARIMGHVGAGTYGNDSNAALVWYKTNGYIQREVDLFGVQFVDGQWDVVMPW
jgi:Tfp pilus assembly protein FimT